MYLLIVTKSINLNIDSLKTIKAYFYMLSETHSFFYSIKSMFLNAESCLFSFVCFNKDINLNKIHLLAILIFTYLFIKVQRNLHKSADF